MLGPELLRRTVRLRLPGIRGAVWKGEEMLNCLFSFGQSPRPEVRKETSVGTSFRPSLERLEEREVPSANPLDALLGSVPGLLPIQFTSLTNPQVNSSGQLQLTGQGQVGGIPFNVPVTLSSTAGSNGSQILDLHINPIHLNLLGLNVATSSICLDITTQPGAGNLLGNLLNGLGSALNGGTISNLISNPVNNLLTSLTTTALLDGVLNDLTAASSLGASTSASGDNVLPTGANDILHLSLGPVNLNLLGLDVALDNCNKGPVVADVYTQPGGGLLGDLLGGISNALNPSGTNLGTEQLLGTLVGNIFTLL